MAGSTQPSLQRVYRRTPGVASTGRENWRARVIGAPTYESVYRNRAG